MKWLILLTLISCGKDQVPPALDLADNDGDQIFNQLESDYDKYVANYEGLGIVKGVIKHSAFSSSLNFSNYSELQSDAMKLMIGEDISSEKKEFFSEWNLLNIDFIDQSFQTSTETNLLHLYFESTQALPDELFLREGKIYRSLGMWAPYMQIQLNKSEFNNLMKGKMKLELKKTLPRGKFQEKDSDLSIKEKTRKVYISNRSKTEVIYVSKNISDKKIRSLLGIHSTVEVSNNLLFFNSQEQGAPQWFEREINGEKVFIFSTIHELKKEFHQRMNATNTVLKRENGVPVNHLQLDLKEKSKIYLKLRPQRIMRTFNEYTNSKSHRSGSPRHGSDDSWVCHYYMRNIASETQVLTTIADLFDNLNWDLEHKQDFKYLEQIDDRGVFWEITFISNDLNTLSIAPRPESTFTTTGQYNFACDRNLSPVASSAGHRTNEENSFSLEIESLVEKIP